MANSIETGREGVSGQWEPEASLLRSVAGGCGGEKKSAPKERSWDGIGQAEITSFSLPSLSKINCTTAPDSLEWAPWRSA